ncbi:hypothetical protein EDD68_1392 [Melghiribacillus thermohalophilus]|uniref:Secreted protein n=1 Tax=Melghiribacillus thermohalophilus TaxID=1324956 RepID=A0A4R3MNC8_9BACI|nr:hypothetical protein [Melghiribacillus thermohalophilus]TCT14850.1 hypothetical protein EDD68_1392 [Melghiribacillus thermohalophilus]
MKKKFLATTLLIGGLFAFSFSGLSLFAADEGNVGGINSISDIAADEGNVGGIYSIGIGDL